MMKLQPEEPIAKAVWWSCMVHAGLIVLFVAKEAVLPSTPKLVPPTLRVDLVGLPDILKKDLRLLKPSLPTAEEPKKAPTVTEPEAPEPDEMALKTKEKLKEKQKAAEKAADRAEDQVREKKISSALARIRSLEKVKDESEEANESVVIQGNQISKGSSLSGDAKESLEAGYYDLVRETLSANWSIPAWLSRQKYSAQVQITVDSQGNLTGTRFMRHSGNDQFDAEVRNTLKASQPFPRPPKELADSVASRGILVGFPL